MNEKSLPTTPPSAALLLFPVVLLGMVDVVLADRHGLRPSSGVALVVVTPVATFVDTPVVLVLFVEAL